MAAAPDTSTYVLNLPDAALTNAQVLSVDFTTNAIAKVNDITGKLEPADPTADYMPYNVELASIRDLTPALGDLLYAINDATWGKITAAGTTTGFVLTFNGTVPVWAQPVPTNAAFVMLSVTPTLPNSRTLTASDGIAFQDGGPGGTFNLTLTGKANDLDNLTVPGYVVFNGSNIITRTLTTDGTLDITNPAGSAANSQLSVVDNTSTQRIRVSETGILVGTRKELNFLDSVGVDVILTDDPINDRIDIQFDALGDLPFDASGENTGVGNTFLGYNNGLLATIANNCVGVGADSFPVLTEGDKNVSAGSESFSTLTTGAYNTSVGCESAQSLVNTDYNTFVGYDTGNPTPVAPVTWNGCTFLGAGATSNITTLTNATAIGRNARVNTSNSIVLGSDNIKVGINNQSPAYALSLGIGDASVTPAIHLAPAASLPAPASGIHMRVGATASSEGLFLTSQYNTGFVVTTEFTSEAELNIGDLLVGNSAGNSSPLSIGTEGQVLGINGGVVAWVDNESLFDEAGSNTATGNTQIGFQNGQSLTSGTRNTGVGSSSFEALTTGVQNSGIGNDTLNLLTTGSQNTAIGAGSLTNFATISNVTAIGYNSGIPTPLSDLAWQNSTFLGAATGSNVAGLINSTAVGYNAQVNRSNSVVLGSGCNVGIGTSDPTYGLSIGSGINPVIHLATSAPASKPASGTVIRTGSFNGDWAVLFNSQQYSNEGIVVTLDYTSGPLRITDQALLVGNSSGTTSELAIGSEGQVPTVQSGNLVYATPVTHGRTSSGVRDCNMQFSGDPAPLSYYFFYGPYDDFVSPARYGGSTPISEDVDAFVRIQTALTTDTYGIRWILGAADSGGNVTRLPLGTTIVARFENLRPRQGVDPFRDYVIPINGDYFIDTSTGGTTDTFEITTESTPTTNNRTFIFKNWAGGIYNSTINQVWTITETVDF